MKEELSRRTGMILETVPNYNLGGATRKPMAVVELGGNTPHYPIAWIPIGQFLENGTPIEIVTYTEAVGEGQHVSTEIIPLAEQSLD